MSWIDAHSHVWTPNTQRYPHRKSYPVPAGAEHIKVEPEDFSPEILFDHARPSDVDRVVLIQMSFYGTDNSYLADCIAGYPQSLRGVAYVDQDEGRLPETMEALLKQGMTGFRIIPMAGTEAHWLRAPASMICSTWPARPVRPCVRSSARMLWPRWNACVPGIP